jgi:hypothetical protein
MHEVIDQGMMLTEHGGKREHNAVEWLHGQIARESQEGFGSLSDMIPL